jgi:phosphate transport system permease protein
MREQEAGTYVHTRRDGRGPAQGRGRVVPSFTARQYWTDVGMRGLLCLAALSSIAITVGIVGILVYEASTFFRHVTLTEFLTDPLWTPLFAMPHYGIMSLVAGTVVTTGVALAVALPIGTIVAIYLSEYAPLALREILKPVLELLSAVPTVVYGYFALLFVAPLLQKVLTDLPTFSMLSAGIVMGIMIIPYVSSLSEDAMRAVPVLVREGSYAMGANRLMTALKVIYPSALSGIAAAYILGISRAIGETMIVAIAAGMQPNLTWNPMEPAATITAFIVQVSLGDLPHGGIGYQSIFAAGLMLFLMTLLFNIVGYLLRKRYREIY